MFENVSIAPPDSILGLNEAFRADDRSPKVNLTVGVYKDENLETPILNSVKSAAAKILAAEPSKTYLGMDGLPAFTTAVKELVFEGTVDTDRCAVVQTPGGTCALRVAAEALAGNFPGQRIFVSQPTWANHRAIFAAAGLQIESYSYLNVDQTNIDFEAMIDTLENQTRPGDAVCLHACCHNPTGIDPTAEQWSAIGDLLTRKQLLPFFDFAYHGFGSGLDSDAAGLQSVLSKVDEAVVCSSFSKNFGLYSERVGAATFVCNSPTTASAVMSQLKLTVRCNYSNPPRHGGTIVATILGDDELKTQWHDELTSMRNRINEMRSLFVETLTAKCSQKDFGFLRSQNGMFSFTGLSPMQVDWLKNEKAIYIVGSGRVNVAGMSAETMPYLCESIAESIAG